MNFYERQTDVIDEVLNGVCNCVSQNCEKSLNLEVNKYTVNMCYRFPPSKMIYK